VANNQPEDIIKHALSLKPGDPKLSESLAGVYRDSGRAELAIDIYKDLVKRFPEQSNYVVGLGNCFEKQGMLVEAANYYIRAANIEPQGIDYLYGLADLLVGINEFEQAKKILDVIPIDHNSARDLELRILVKEHLEDFSNIDQLYQSQTDINGDGVAYHVAHARSLSSRGLFSESQEKFKVAIASTQESTNQALDYAQRCNEALDYETAKFVLEGLVKHEPGNFVANYNLGNCYQNLGDYKSAETCFINAIEINSNSFGSYNNLANIYRAQGKSKLALVRFEQALECKDASVDLILSNKGAMHIDIGEVDKAFDCYQKAIEYNPDNQQAISNFLYGINYLDSLSENQIFEHHKRWSEKFYLTNDIRESRGSVNDGRPIVIGFVSADFRMHSVAYFFLSLLEGRNNESFSIICYSNREYEDSITQRIKASADAWRQIHHLTDDDAAALIKKDSVDVLVDLSGHTDGRRQSLFALKPVAVQATWLGYPNTTGNKSIDYRITDAVADPEGDSDAMHVEKLVRLPSGFLCYDGNPELTLGELPPMSKSGTITFGSFNNITKINASVIALWGKLLNQIEGSRLLVKSKMFEDNDVTQTFIDQFALNNVSQDKLILVKHSPSYEDHMNLYNEIDIALDTFPYNGTTTTCEALWMGVPVLSLTHESHRGRVTKSILHRVDMDDFALSDKRNYINFAKKISSEPSVIEHYKRSLRPKMLDSKLTSRTVHANEMESLFRQMLS